MSKSGPSAFVVVGDTDWWDVARKNTEIGTDSRLRRAQSLFWTAGQDGIVAARSLQANSQPIYIEALATGYTGGSNAIGLGLVPYTLASYSDLHLAANNVFFWSGSIYVNGASVETSLGTVGGDERWGISLYKSGGQAYAQFYRNGVAVGTAKAIADVAYCFGVQFSFTDRSWVMYPDNQDQKYRPAGNRAWGAAARAADAGGYSRSSAKFSSANASVTVDSFGRTVRATAATGQSALADSPSRPVGGQSSLLHYVEFVCDVESTGQNDWIGLGTSSANLAQWCGANAQSVGYRGDGSKHYNGSSTSGYSAWTTGDILGAIYKPSTGEVWFTKTGVAIEGDPEAGTGASYTLTAGTFLYPMATIRVDGRIRLASHAREQQHRPSYTVAWDGADLLPEQHFADTIARSPIVRRAISFAQWGSRSNRSSPIGYLDIDNTDGDYDDLIDFDLRDQDIIAYRLPDDGVPQREWTGVIDSLECPSDDVLRVIVADKTAPLDVRVDSPVFAIGNPELVPATSRQGSTITFDVSQLTANTFSVYDQAAEVSSWERDDTSDFAGFTRTENPVSGGLHSVKDLSVLRTISTLNVLNPDFDNWSGSPEEPDDWTTFASGVGAYSRNGNAIRLELTGSGGGAALITQSGHTFTAGNRYAFRINISAVAGTQSGTINLDIGAQSTAIFGYHADTATVGEHVFFVDVLANATSFTIALDRSSGGAAFSIDVTSVAAFEADETYTPSKALTYLLEDLSGLSSSDWTYSDPLSPYSPGEIGMWTNQRPTVRALFGEIMDSLLCDYYTDADGVIQLAWLTPPEEVTSSDSIYLGEIVEADLHGGIRVEDDLAPNLSTRAEYQRNYVKHGSGNVADTTYTNETEFAVYVQSDRKENALVLSGTGASDAAALHTFYAHANNGPPMPRVVINDFTTSNTPVNGSTTVDNRLILLHRCYASRRRFYSFEISRELADELTPYPGAVVELTHARYGLSSGKNLMIVSIEQSIDEPTVRMRCWG